MGIFTFVLNGVALLFVFSFPFAMANLGWKTYMMNGSWDVLEVVFIWFYWVETKGKSLEEIDEVLEGRKHSEVPDLEQVARGAEVGESDVLASSSKGVNGVNGEVHAVNRGSIDKE